jgi:hypothetical protein
MKSAVRAAIRARTSEKLNLTLLTHEQAVYAVMDRAMLFNELENSWWRSARRGVGFIAVPALLVSLVLLLCRATLFPALSWHAIAAPLGVAALLLAVLWFADLLMLAREGVDARTARTLGQALQPPEEHRVVINEGTEKKNLNDPPIGPRPPPPKAQVAPAGDPHA